MLFSVINPECSLKHYIIHVSIIDLVRTIKFWKIHVWDYISNLLINEPNGEGKHDEELAQTCKAIQWWVWIAREIQLKVFYSERRYMLSSGR